MSEKIRPVSVLRADELRIARHERRRSLYDEVLRLHGRGVPQHAIARRLRISRNAVRRYVRADDYPEPLRGGRRKGSALDRYKLYVLGRWREGCTNATRIWHELREQGFRRGVDVVMRFVAVLRQQLSSELREQVRRHTSGKTPLPRVTTLAARSPREVVWLMLRDPCKLSSDGRMLLDHLFTASAEIAAAYTFAQSFRRMISERRPERLRAWLAGATRCHVREVRSFA